MERYDTVSVGGEQRTRRHYPNLLHPWLTCLIRNLGLTELMNPRAIQSAPAKQPRAVDYWKGPEIT
jgi:hypothetical protein